MRAPHALEPRAATHQRSTPHKDLEFTQLEPLFSCVLTEEGVALGLRFSNDQQEQVFLKHLDTLLHPVPEPAAPTNKEPPPFLYCINRVWNRKDDSVKRGAVVRAMSFMTRHQYVQAFKVRLLAQTQIITERSIC